MMYQGVGMHESFDNGRINGTIDVTNNTIKFSYEGGIKEFPLEGIEISTGGSGSRIFYFRHHLYPDWCFYSDDKGIAKDPILLGTRSGKQASTQAKSSRRIFMTLGISFLLIVALLFGSIFLFKDKLINKIAHAVPVEWEKQAGDAMFQSITQSSKLVKDSLLNVQMNELASKVTKAVDDTTFKFKFYIIEDTTLNAFALPGGNVVVHSGLILRANNAEEVLGVLGHEIAHVTQRHHARSLIGKMGMSFILQSLLGSDSDLANLIIDVGGNLQSLKYSRDLENEADDKGFEYLVKANINPQGMISFFKKLQQVSGAGNEEAENNLSFLSTHPATRERIDHLQKKLDKSLDNQSFSKVSFDFTEFQSALMKDLKK